MDKKKKKKDITQFIKKNIMIQVIKKKIFKEILFKKKRKRRGNSI